MAKRRKLIDKTIEQPIRASDLGTPELHKRVGGIQITINLSGEAVGRVAVQRPIDLYLEKGFIEDYQYQAARSFEEDYHYQQQYIAQSRSNLEFELGSGNPKVDEEREKTRKRYSECIARLGKHDSGVLEAIICDKKYFGDLKQDWMQSILTASAGEILGDILEKVAVFYGLTSKGKK